MPGTDGHYLSFDQVYGTNTNESYRPSLKKNSTKKLNKKKLHSNKQEKQMPFNPTSQYAKNVGTVIQCGDCEKWRVLYSKKKITSNEKLILDEFLEAIIYTCGYTCNPNWFRDFDGQNYSNFKCRKSKLITAFYN
jgi:hypothetical protein